MPVFYKFLDEFGRCKCGNATVEFPLPEKNSDGTWTPSEWVPYATDVGVACVETDEELGCYELHTIDSLMDYVGPKLYVAQQGRSLIPTRSGRYTYQYRLLEEVESWNEASIRGFLCDNAERVLPVYEHAYPGDFRPRDAIEAARRLAAGIHDIPAEFAFRDFAETALLRSANVASERAMEACVEAMNIPAKHAAMAAALAAMTHLTDLHIAHHIPDATRAAQLAAFGYVKYQAEAALDTLGFSGNYDLEMPVSQAAQKLLAAMKEWQQNKIKEIVCN